LRKITFTFRKRPMRRPLLTLQQALRICGDGLSSGIALRILGALVPLRNGGANRFKVAGVLGLTRVEGVSFRLPQLHPSSDTTARERYGST
jgi:hypothetical protein